MKRNEKLAIILYFLVLTISIATIAHTISQYPSDTVLGDVKLWDIVMVVFLFYCIDSVRNSVREYVL